MEKKPRLLVVNAYEVAPQMSGGDRRIKELYASLLPYLDIDLCTIARDYISGGYRMLAPDFYETCVARSMRQQDDIDSVEATFGSNGSHASTDRRVRLNAAYVDQITNRLGQADIAVTCHPYLYPLLRSLWSGPIVYHSHDVEADLQKELIPDTPAGRELHAAVIANERDCVRDCAFTVAMSAEDAERFVQLHGADPKRIIAVPPSLDFGGSVLPSVAFRAAVKSKIMAVAGPMVVFMGSNWGPNIIAALAIIGFARQFPGVTFAIVGSVAHGLLPTQIPPNVNVTGFVSEETKRLILLGSDVAVNPTVASSGVNMKMSDYFMSGTPVVTTVDGARGLALSERHAWIVDVGEFPRAIAEALGNPGAARSRAENAHGHARAYFDESANAIVLASRFKEVARRSTAAGPETPSERQKAASYRSSSPHNVML